jgi:hypothetical protein
MVILWFAGMAAVSYYWGSSTVATLGIGVAGGVIISKFGNMMDSLLSHLSSEKDKTVNTKS